METIIVTTVRTTFWEEKAPRSAPQLLRCQSVPEAWMPIMTVKSNTPSQSDGALVLNMHTLPPQCFVTIGRYMQGAIHSVQFACTCHIAWSSLKWCHRNAGIPICKFRNSKNGKCAFFFHESNQVWCDVCNLWVTVHNSEWTHGQCGKQFAFQSFLPTVAQKCGMQFRELQQQLRAHAQYHPGLPPNYLASLFFPNVSASIEHVQYTCRLLKTLLPDGICISEFRPAFSMYVSATKVSDCCAHCALLLVTTFPKMLVLSYKQATLWLPDPEQSLYHGEALPHDFAYSSNLLQSCAWRPHPLTFSSENSNWISKAWLKQPCDMCSEFITRTLGDCDQRYLNQWFTCQSFLPSLAFACGMESRTLHAWLLESSRYNTDSPHDYQESFLSTDSKASIDHIQYTCKLLKNMLPHGIIINAVYGNLAIHVTSTHIATCCVHCSSTLVASCPELCILTYFEGPAWMTCAVGNHEDDHIVFRIAGFLNRVPPSVPLQHRTLGSHSEDHKHVS